MIGWRTAASLADLGNEISQARVELTRLGDADVQQFVAAASGAVEHLRGLEVTTPVAEEFRAIKRPLQALRLDPMQILLPAPAEASKPTVEVS